MRNPIVSNCLGLIGGLLGGVLGYYVFFWITRQGFYGLMIPGAVLGLGCSLLAQHRSWTRGIVAGLAALALGVYTEWKFEPFRADDSFSYLVKHLGDLRPITLLMLVLGGFFGFWLGKDASPLVGGGEPRPAGGKPTSK